jgi:class 3 adenylate cyclase/tetratricopeptide (TPR) repeat protein
MQCPSCGADNRQGGKFCRECGSALVRACPSCGTPVLSDAKFCDECGATLAGAFSSGPGNATTAAPNFGHSGTGTELRHVSVLFCDLVGFTPLSEQRDPEAVRELLSGYFDLARAIVGRYGGVIQKFIGDAVMAVWGAPVANEDDAERAVRAGLELVSAVSPYGHDLGLDLAARVGIVTGSAATTETAEEGLVIGDRVNTAARIQSVAPPGCCCVDETTRAATAAAIAYLDSGTHELKGKAEPIRVYQATRVIAAVAGSQRSSGLEAPFTGRDHELRLVKELFHASAERRSARLVLVSGVAGVGKSRLAWEFFKYIDGLAGGVLWHAGRCLSYGEGVSYWALSEMVRARLQISEEDEQDVVAERLRTGLERWILDPANREFIAPRLGQLLGLPAAQVLAREELFYGWRLFFERLAEHQPVVMAVEDLQWADAGMVDFLDHLLEWSSDHAIFLLVLTRPEGSDKRGLGLSRRNVTTVSLDPLSDEVIGELLDGLVADLPASARSSIVERAEGIPLYAVETVRSLLDKGILVKGDDQVLHLVGAIGTLEIPPGLTALIASRLDALSGEERRLVKECSVLGGSFPRQAIEAISDTDPGQLDELLTSLVRKEVLAVRADKLSPERGQYAFTQSLIRSVAYDTLTRAERKARHRRTAEHMRAAFPDQGAEVAEVIAAHLNDAYNAAGEDPDADELRAQAKDAYVLAAERAEAIGAPEAAEAAYRTAAELSSDDAERTWLVESAGRMADQAGSAERALGHFEAAVAAHKAAGRLEGAAKATAWLANAHHSLGRVEQAIGLLREALASMDPDTAPPAVTAELYERLGGLLMYAGHVQEAAEPLEQALTLAQHYELAEPLARALRFKAMLLAVTGRVAEARLDLEASLEVARLNGFTRVEIGVENFLADLCMTRDLPGAEEHAAAGLALARRWGSRVQEANTACNLMYVLTIGGRFEEAYRLGNDVLQYASDENSSFTQIHMRLAILDSHRGDTESARQHLAQSSAAAESDDVQNRAGYASTESGVALAEENFPLALKAALRAIDGGLRDGLGLAHEVVRLGFPDAIDAAMAIPDLGELKRLVDLLASRPPGEVPPFLRAQILRARSLLKAASGIDEGVEEGLVSAEKAFFDMGYPYWTARAQLDQAEWLARKDQTSEAHGRASLAAVTFEQLGTRPMLSRARALLEPSLTTLSAGTPSQTSV